MRGGQLQVIALLRVRHGPAGQKRPAQKCQAAVFLFQRSKVDVVGGTGGVKGALLPQHRHFVRRGDAEDALPRRVWVALFVEGQAEGPVK